MLRGRRARLGRGGAGVPQWFFFLSELYGRARPALVADNAVSDSEASERFDDGVGAVVMVEGESIPKQAQSLVVVAHRDLAPPPAPGRPRRSGVDPQAGRARAPRVAEV